MINVPAAIEQKISGLSIWKRGNERAPNKPLLILIALSKLINEGKDRILYEEIDLELKRLLQEFGPTRKSYHTNYPFWRLENDGIWIIDAPASIRPETTGASDIKKTDLISHQVMGGFASEIIQAFDENPELVLWLIQLILDGHFPETIHEDIRLSLSLPGGSTSFTASKKRKRDPKFRDQVLKAYQNSCAICGFQVILDRIPIAIEAAHIKWHQYHGPDKVENGLALCSVHHKLLDRGAFTINSYGVIKVSELAYGNSYEKWLGIYHDQAMRSPVRSAYEPRADYLSWHQAQVFKGPPRD